MKNEELIPEMDITTGLTPTQEKAAILLASGETISAVAAKVGVNRCTIYDWQGILTFQCFFNRQRKDYKEHLLNSIFALTDEALVAVRDSIMSSNEQIRLKAAVWLLERVSNMEVGQTDVRDCLKKQCTKDIYDWGESLTQFDSSAYDAACKRLGIKPDHDDKK